MEETVKTKAAVLYEYNKPLIIENLELGDPKEKEVLVHFRVAGLCQTDLSIMKGVPFPPLPCVLGHEGAGVVEAVGPGVTKVKPGDHVLLMWVPVCGQCHFCLKGLYSSCVNKQKCLAGTMLDGTHRLSKGGRPIHVQLGVGAFSEYNVVSDLSIIPIAPEIPFDIAIYGCAVATGVGAVFNTAKVRPGSHVAVVGVGGVGLNVIQGAVLANATKIIAIDIIQAKLEMARHFGATHVINGATGAPVEEAMEITGGMGVDFAFETSGKQEAAMTCYQMIGRGGYVVLVGIPGVDSEITLPLREFPLMEKNILGCNYGSGDIRKNLDVLIDLYTMGRLKLSELITSRYELEQINEGFKDLETGKNARGVIEYVGK